MSHVITVTSQSFSTEVLQSNLPVVVDFYATWCPPCRRLAPMLDKLSEDFADKVRFVKINSDEASQLAAEYNVTALPTLVFFEDGEVVGQFSGLPQEDGLRQELRKWISPQSSTTP